jgi:GxxExxY protein
VIGFGERINTKARSEDTEDTKGTVHENEIAHRVIGLAIDVHRALGPGLLESAYEECLYHKLTKAGLHVVKQMPMPLVFEDVKLECGYRLDMLVEHRLVLEVKSCDMIHPVFLAQLLTYLRLGGFRLGLLINFNVEVLKEGIKRVINGKL